ncbi:MAG: YbaK/prolyl-tRNA synthetase associated protein [Rhodoferax sp.]|nr:YbaK/prolyl-tRNA synthetase associated protein [Rhodoferax sp.]
MTPRELLVQRAHTARSSLADIVSPCVSVCRMSPATSLCEGCFRTLTEIADWSRLDDAGKSVVWRRIEQRCGNVDPVVGHAVDP